MAEEVETVEDAQPEQQEVGIGLGDLAACVQIIDIVSKRGAFEGTELTEVGTVRDRLAAFIKAQQPSDEGEGEASEDEASGD